MASSKMSDLDIKEAHAWPIIPKAVLLCFIYCIPLIAGWYLYIQDKNTNLNIEQSKEVELKKKFQEKFAQVQSLEELKEHKKIVAEQVKALEGLLPSKTEMDKLLSDINQAGVSRNLNFELFEPKTAAVKQYYAQIPVNIKIRATYHDIAHFMSDLAGLSRIVNVETLKMTAAKTNDQIELEGSLNTYRLLDEYEKQDQKRKTAASKASGVVANTQDKNKI